MTSVWDNDLIEDCIYSKKDSKSSPKNVFRIKWFMFSTDLKKLEITASQTRIHLRSRFLSCKEWIVILVLYPKLRFVSD